MRLYIPISVKGKVTLIIKSENGVKFDHKETIFVKTLKDAMFIQTDKPTYKPGDKIRFRVIIVDKNLKPPFRQVGSEVFITNAGGSRVMQWSNVTLDKGIISLEMPISVKPVLGKWQITAKYGATKAKQDIMVKKYVLPKFEVTIQSPSYLLKSMKEVPITICAKYTYGKSVVGTLKVKTCLSSIFDGQRRCVEASKSLLLSAIDGCLTTMVGVDRDRIRTVNYPIAVTVKAIVVENATGVAQKRLHATKPFLSNEIKLKFDAPKSFKPGFMYTVKLFVTTPDGRPALNKQVKIILSSKQRYDKKKKHVRTYDPLITNGVYSFNVYPTERADSYYYEAMMEEVEHPYNPYNLGERFTLSMRQKIWRSSQVYFNNYGVYTVGMSQKWASPSSNYIEIANMRDLVAGKSAKITVNIAKYGEVRGKDVHYLLMCRGRIVLSDRKVVYHKHVHITFVVEHEMLPVCRMFVYYISKDGELVSDFKKIHFKMSFKNKVSLSFSDNQKMPGGKVKLTLKATAGSKFALSAVDRSVQLLGASFDLREGQIVDILTRQDVHGQTFQDRKKCDGFSSRYRTSSLLKYDSRRAIENAGLIYFSNAEVDFSDCLRHWHFYAPRATSDRREQRLQYMLAKMNFDKKTKKPDVKKPVKIRSNFPETWLWSDESINSSGENVLQVKIPDTITTWYASGFAMSTRAGIGVAAPASIQAFQPFFVSVALPYSVIRGETVKVPTTVFNYLDDCLVIQVSLDTSTDFDITSERIKKMCVCGSKSNTFKFSIKSKTLGKIDITVKALSLQPDILICDSSNKMADDVTAADAMTKKLLVEAEGIKKEFSTSSYFCPRDHSGLYSDTLFVTIPQPVVQGSVYAELAVVGDLLGPSMDNLDKLLAMPYGCGEQNMLKFAPNIYIMDYLTATNQLTEKVERKAKEYMRSGYQRELTYKHSNGAYSAFGERDKEGSTWLTAFVLRSFSQAKRYIFIDDRDIEDSKRWLLSLQDWSGCFKESGMVHHKEMKGGVSSGITMTAFVVNALLEAKVPHNDSRMQSALACITNRLNKISDPYTAALISYTLSLAGSTKRFDMLNKLDSMSSQADGMLHWEATSVKDHRSSFCYQAPSTDIEMTAYSMMAYIGGQSPFKSKIEHLKIVKWLVKQRNPFGGFASTQDTCVGLQALSQYSAGAISNLTIMATTPTGFSKEFKVRNDNKLLLQRAVLLNVPTNISIQATGDGCTLVQANVKYNIPVPKEKPSFYLDITVEELKTINCEHKIKVCGSYMKSGKSNMALIDVNMVSGFEPIVSELDMIMQSTSAPFSYYEFIDGVLSIYFDDLDQSSTCVTFKVEQVAEVEGRKPAAVKLYDYYDTDKSATTMYNVERCPEINAA
ncbi:pregnancy zone protein-like isoform X2 [Hydractinia symbiolongicarpus]|nr:pregnancy zone protein-like isoform X2 [Hydractinia symbiolongicarpus]XP_057308931.1 pregnancy zone protein-like isoform X2 [Hydractinia symbiolongicarpus]XP_057308939.1 pregnancy zone protein-like isoform X2 [Hydractinia symbiolongicarpus]XP_057308947.1 pregnancy zone protein-like isoform X2 [Hydractinia symbiolongicarpus]XP_057308955.1 pregnancy zone protein-like isoform X2 [Hydractinia symbiolongicarpus]XP_057308961.1 pregnancy zone protein-like isoform X2 [Hydractinia symbiolongicarpus]